MFQFVESDFVKHSSGVDEGKSLEKSSAETVLPAVNGEVFTKHNDVSAHASSIWLPKSRGQESVSVWSSTVDDDYFQTMGISLLHGRPFQLTDRVDSPRVAIVNELFAKHYLGRNPIGKRIRLNQPGAPWLEIVGVTPTIRYVQLFEPPLEYLYLPFSQNPRARGDHR